MPAANGYWLRSSKTSDAQGVRLINGVLAADDSSGNHQQFVEGGWNSSGAPRPWRSGSAGAGADGLMKMWNAANQSFALCPLLNAGATKHSNSAVRIL